MNIATSKLHNEQVNTDVHYWYMVPSCDLSKSNGVVNANR